MKRVCIIVEKTIYGLCQSTFQNVCPYSYQFLIHTRLLNAHVYPAVLWVFKFTHTDKHAPFQFYGTLSLNAVLWLVILYINRKDWEIGPLFLAWTVIIFFYVLFADTYTVYAGADPGFLRGGGPKFEIMRAKYWYVMVTNSDVMRGGGVGAGRGEFPPPSSAKRGSFDVSFNY